MLIKNMFRFMAVMLAAIAAVLMPVMVFAHGGGDGGGRGGDDNNRWGRDHKERRDDRSDRGGSQTNEFGVRVLEDNGKNKGQSKHWRQGFSANLFYNGTVTATSSTGFTITTKDDTTFTVDADSAKIIQIPRTEIALSDIEVGDSVHITGSLNGTTIEAIVVYSLPENLKPAVAKGTVTAVTENTITVQTKEDAEITVNTTPDTQIVNSDHEPVTQADIESGSTVKLFGLWDSVLNVFNAIKVKIWS